MEKFLTDDLWPTLDKLAKKPEQMKIAVAFLGSQARELNWKKGDVLIVALTQENVLNELVDIDVLRDLLEKGVAVYSIPNLHAKVYLFEEEAIVGSANLSRNSKENLSEAAICTKNSIILESVRNYFEIHTKDDDLRITIEKFDNLFPDLWFINTVPYENNDHQNKIVSEHFVRWENQAQNEGWNRCEIMNIDPQNFEIKIGDYVIVHYKGTEIYPPRLCYDFNEQEKIIFLKHPTRMASLPSKIIIDAYGEYLSSGKIIQQKIKILQTFNKYYREK